MNHPLISVIVPVYKVEAYIDRCIQSIVDQSYENMEIILVDDGSPDKCPEICDSWAEKDSRIMVIHKKNGGLSSARNAGLDICKGEFISFVDSDDWIEPEYYSTVVDLMIRHNVEICCAGRYDVDEITLVKRVGLCPVSQEIISPEGILKRMLTWRGCDFSACDKIFHTSLWKENRFPMGKTSEDVGVLYKVVELANGILLYPKPMYHYFHRKVSITTTNLSSRNKDIVEFAGDICVYTEHKYPRAVPEAKYFKLKTLLYWLRSFYLQREHTVSELDLYRASQLWLAKNFIFALLSCRYVSWKDRVWYALITLRMKRAVQWLVKRSI